MHCNCLFSSLCRRATRRFLDQGHILYMIFQDKYFSCYILLTDQILLPVCLYFLRYWAIYALQLFIFQSVQARNQEIFGSRANFVYDFSRQIFLMLYSFNRPNFIACLPLLLEILGNICIAIVYFPVCAGALPGDFWIKGTSINVSSCTTYKEKVPQ